MVLQNYMAYSTTMKCDELTVVKDEVTDVKEEGDQLETTSTEIYDEPLVSCMSACLKCCTQRIFTQSCPSLLISNTLILVKRY